MARAFVQPKYQSAAGGRKALFALDNLWDGIGGLIATDPTVKYLSGKVTIYSTSPEMSRKAMVYYLDMSFGDREGLITSKNPETCTPEQAAFFKEMFTGADYKENPQAYKIWKQDVTADDVLTMDMARGGGFAISFLEK